MTVIVQRNAGHPWSGDPGWDQLHLDATDIEALHVLVGDAEAKHWHVWIHDQERVAAALYKPAGASTTWVDEPRLGTDKAACVAIEVGDVVDTDFSRKITRHTVTDRTERNISQTGIMLRVTPPVPGSGYVAEDPGYPSKTHNNAWIDSAWFRKAFMIVL